MRNTDINSILNDLSTRFRTAIDDVLSTGGFDNDKCYREFPSRCCGDTCDLLGQYLLCHGIQTWTVSGTHYPIDGTEEENFENKQSHAWLATSNPRKTSRYTIIDITGDQFKYDPEYGFFDKKVYVGKTTDFHRLFEVLDSQIYINRGIDELNDAAPRLRRLYKLIMERYQ